MIVWSLVPVAAAALLARYLVPTPSEAAGSWAEPLARLADEHALAFFLAGFVCLSALTEYWMARYLERAKRPPAKPLSGRVWWGAIVAVALAVLALRSLVGVFQVESASMLPTLKPLDTLVGVRLGYGAFPLSVGDGRVPARGDLVVFDKPPGVEGPPSFVKRVVGLPGDWITMKGAVPVINGEPADVCQAGPYVHPLPLGGAAAGISFVEYLDGRAHLAMYASSPAWSGSYEVKPGEVFVLGDNRDNSNDSRAWNGGKGGGLSIASIRARITSRLLEVTRDERTHVDAGRPVELSLREAGIDTSAVMARIGECLGTPAEADPALPVESLLPSPGVAFFRSDRGSPIALDAPAHPAVVRQ